MLTYATFKPEEKFRMKTSNDDSYVVLKKELNDAVFDVKTIDELDIWFDDEFLLRGEELIPTFVIKNVEGNNVTERDILICGTIVFTSHDEEGNTVSLTNNAAQTILKFKHALIGEHHVLVYENY